MSDKLIDQQELEARRDEKKIHSKVCEALNYSIASIDVETRHRLEDIRQQALAQTESREQNRHNYWLPSVGIAAAVLVVVLWQGAKPQWQLNNTPAQQQAELLDPPDEWMSGMASDWAQTQQPWDVEEDLLDKLEFYTWLMMEETHAG